MTKVFQGLPIMTWTRRELQHEKAYSIAITGYFLATSTRFCEISRSISSRISEPLLQADFQTQPEINERMKGFWDTAETSWEVPGNPEGSKNRPKSGFFLQKCIPTADFLSIFECTASFRDFCAICHWFFMINP